VGGASERGWKPGHLNHLDESFVDEVKFLDVDVGERVDDADTLVGEDACYYKDVEVDDDEEEEEQEELQRVDSVRSTGGGEGGGLRRKRTIRVVIRSRAFL
jgi:hypothetical protein